MADHLNVAAPSDDALAVLKEATRLDYSTLARLALCHSLRTLGPEVARSLDYRGRELRRHAVLGEDEGALKALVHQIYGRKIEPDDEFFSRRSVVKDHIDAGLPALVRLLGDSGGDDGVFYVRLAGVGDSTRPEPGAAPALDILVGRRTLKRSDVVLELNNTGRHANPHLAITGKPGVGKTQLLLKILADIRVQSGFRTHFVFFDYKGDVAGNDSFIEVSRAHRYCVPDVCVPVSPFVQDDYTDAAVLLSAREKAESFGSINPRFGTVQKGHLTEAIRQAYLGRTSESFRYPDFPEILAIVRQRYAAEGRADDGLVETLKDLADFRLFWDHDRAEAPVATLMDHTCVIDLHRLPVLKELVAYLAIERIYKEMSALSDSAVEKGRRQVRTILVIDEAHNYLRHKNLFLQKIVREGRSKGVAVFFASQSPNDYVQKDFDFKELLEFTLLFQCDGVTPAAVSELLGCGTRAARELSSEIARLGTHEVMAKPLPGEQDDALRFRALSFFEAYPDGKRG